MVLLLPRIKQESKQHRSWQMRLRVVRVSEERGAMPLVENPALDAGFSERYAFDQKFSQS